MPNIDYEELWDKLLRVKDSREDQIDKYYIRWCLNHFQLEYDRFIDTMKRADWDIGLCFKKLEQQRELE